MVKSLFILFMLVLSGHTIGGFLNGCDQINNHAIENSYRNRMESILAYMARSQQDDKDSSGHGENQEIVEIPTCSDAYCQRSCIIVKSSFNNENPGKNYREFYISHYPWAPKEISTPPPKA